MSLWNRFGFGFPKPLGTKPLGIGKKAKSNSFRPQLDQLEDCALPTTSEGSKNKLTRFRESYPNRIRFNRFILGAGMVRTN